MSWENLSENLSDEKNKINKLLEKIKNLVSFEFRFFFQFIFSVNIYIFIFSANQFKQTRFLFAFVHLKLSMFAYVRFHLNWATTNANRCWFAY